MDLILRLLRTRRGSNRVFIVMDRFNKIVHFITCHKIDDTINITNLFFKDVVHLHVICRTIIKDKDVKFWGHF